MLTAPRPIPISGRGEPTINKKNKPNVHRKQKDRTELQATIRKTKPMYRKQQRPTGSKIDLAVSKKTTH